MHDIDALKGFIRNRFCENVGLAPDEVFGPDLTLAALIHRSGKLTNSVDLLEAFARTSNALRKEFGLRVRLPALSLETPISRVLEVFVEEVRRQGRAA